MLYAILLLVILIAIVAAISRQTRQQRDQFDRLHPPPARPEFDDGFCTECGAERGRMHRSDCRAVHGRRNRRVTIAAS